MSTESKAPRKATTGLARTKFNIDKGGNAHPPVIEKIDVAAFEIDDSFDINCDPYNSTGQFLIEALKKKYDD